MPKLKKKRIKILIRERKKPYALEPKPLLAKSRAKAKELASKYNVKVGRLDSTKKILQKIDAKRLKTWHKTALKRVKGKRKELVPKVKELNEAVKQGLIKIKMPPGVRKLEVTEHGLIVGVTSSGKRYVTKEGRYFHPLLMKGLGERAGLDIYLAEARERKGKKAELLEQLNRLAGDKVTSEWHNMAESELRKKLKETQEKREKGLEKLRKAGVPETKIKKIAEERVGDLRETVEKELEDRFVKKYRKEIAEIQKRHGKKSLPEITKILREKLEGRGRARAEQAEKEAKRVANAEERLMKRIKELNKFGVKIKYPKIPAGLTLGEFYEITKKQRMQVEKGEKKVDEQKTLNHWRKFKEQKEMEAEIRREAEKAGGTKIMAKQIAFSEIEELANKMPRELLKTELLQKIQTFKKAEEAASGKAVGKTPLGRSLVELEELAKKMPATELMKLIRAQAKQPELLTFEKAKAIGPKVTLLDLAKDLVKETQEQKVERWHGEAAILSELEEAKTQFRTEETVAFEEKLEREIRKAHLEAKREKAKKDTLLQELLRATATVREVKEEERKKQLELLRKAKKS